LIEEENGRQRGLRLRRVDGGRKAGERFYLTVPRRIAEKLPDEARFEPELVEDGVLYRRLPPEEVPPSWARD
jgi:hypothetical protein